MQQEKKKRQPDKWASQGGMNELLCVHYAFLMAKYPDNAEFMDGREWNNH